MFVYLQEYGFLDLLLPALLIFAVIFGTLQKIGLFQTERVQRNAQGQETGRQRVSDRKINGIISLLIAFAVTLPHAAGLYPANMDPILLIYKFLPNTAVMIAAVLSVLLVIGMTSRDFPSNFQLLFAIIGAVILVIVFLFNIFPSFLPWFDFLRDPAIQAFLIVILIAGLVIYFAMREGPRGTAQERAQRFRRFVGPE